MRSQPPGDGPDIEVIVDPDLPLGTIEARYRGPVADRVTGRILNLATDGVWKGVPFGDKAPGEPTTQELLNEAIDKMLLKRRARLTGSGIIIPESLSPPPPATTSNRTAQPQEPVTVESIRRTMRELKERLGPPLPDKFIAYAEDVKYIMRRLQEKRSAFSPQGVMDLLPYGCRIYTWEDLEDRQAADQMLRDIAAGKVIPVGALRADLRTFAQMFLWLRDPKNPYTRKPQTEADTETVG